MQHSIFSRELVESIVNELKITDLAQATIGQVVLLASALENAPGFPLSGWIRECRGWSLAG